MNKIIPALAIGLALIGLATLSARKDYKVGVENCLKVGNSEKFCRINYERWCR